MNEYTGIDVREKHNQMKRLFLVTAILQVLIVDHSALLLHIPQKPLRLRLREYVIMYQL